MAQRKYVLFSIISMIGLVALYPDTSIPSINELMSIEDQQRTGVIRLTQKQKMELAKWLVEHQYNAEAASDEIIHALTVALNIAGGKFIELSDNSVWEISPDDLVVSQSWLSPIPVKITPSSNPNYPFIITDLRSGQSVKAKKGQLP